MTFARKAFGILVKRTLYIPPSDGRTGNTGCSASSSATSPPVYPFEIDRDLDAPTHFPDGFSSRGCVKLERRSLIDAKIRGDAS